MKNLIDYIEKYGMGGWKTDDGSDKSPIVMMLRDEIALPGTTILSQFDRIHLERSFLTMSRNPGNDWQDERYLGNAETPFNSMHLDGSKVEMLTFTGDWDAFNPKFDAAWKANGAIKLIHGEKDNPFTQHTDWLSGTGTVQKDVLVKTDLVALEAYYRGAINYATFFKTNIFEESKIITSPQILAKMLQLVLQNGIDTAENVTKYFDNYAFAPDAADTAIRIETKLADVPALGDPTSDQLFKAYIAYFGRPADPAGLQYWVDGIKGAGGDVTGMVNVFGESAEYKSLYLGASSHDIVNSLYQNLFNRDSDKAGLDFWAGHMDSGTLSLSNIAFTIVTSAQSTDAAIIVEKVNAARAFTSSLDTQRELDLYSNDASALNARKWLSAVGQDQASTVKLVGIVNDVINGLQNDAEPILAAIGFQPGYQ